MTDDSTLTGVIHLHSCYSFDSFTSIRSIASIAVREHLDFVILTDHNTIAGSIALREYVSMHGIKLEVPIAAEYHTDLGDVIAAFIKTEINARDFPSFAREVRDQNGLIILPHPYLGHKQTELLAEAADLIEVFNGRTSDAKNQRALSLAESLGKPSYYGSDAHLALSIANVVFSVEKDTDLPTSLLKGQIEPLRCIPIGRADLQISRLTKIVKTHDFKPLLSAISRRIRW